MINKIILPILIGSVLFTADTNYSTTSVVTLVGAKIAASNKEEVVKKHKRKDCPVCMGKGWYISGDGIKKIECQYCEPESKQETTSNIVYK